jgi:hypothetical protein
MDEVLLDNMSVAYDARQTRPAKDDEGDQKVA